MTKNTIQPSLRSRQPIFGGVVLVATAALVLVSCGNGGDTTEPTTGALTTTQTVSQPTTGDPPDTPQPGGDTATTTVKTDQVVTTVTGPSPLGQPSLAQKNQSPNGWEDLLVTGARLATHPTFDRVVFDFSGGGTPGWFIDFTDTPTQQGSGLPVEFQGTTALYVAIEGTNYPPFDDPDAPVLGTVPGTGGVVQEVIYTSIFEGRTEYVIGLDSRQPYSVTALENPTRLVIDILQPE